MRILSSREVRSKEQNEGSHTICIGSTRTGKTSFLKRELSKLLENGESCIIFDPEMEFYDIFFDKERGDLILNPFSEDYPGWNLYNEIKYDYQADFIAESLIQNHPKADPFWIISSRALIRSLLLTRDVYQRNHEALYHWLFKADLYDLISYLSSYETESCLSADLEKTSLSVLFEARSGFSWLRYVKDPVLSGFQIRNWIKRPEGSCLFLTMNANQSGVLKGFYSLMIDLMISEILSVKVGEGKRINFFLDEITSLPPLLSIDQAMSRGLKHRLSLFIGTQSLNQLQASYGLSAENICTNSLNKVIFRTTEPNSANYLSSLLLGEYSPEKIMSLPISRAINQLIDGKAKMIDVPWYCNRVGRSSKENEIGEMELSISDPIS